MAAKVDVLMPSSSQYEVLHHFAKSLYEAFVRQGAVCRLLSGDDRLYFPLNSPPDFTIGFNGAIKMEDDTLFCDQIKVPHISCLVDPPFRFLELTKSNYVIITCDDLEGCRLLKERGFKQTLFMPHAVEPELSFDAKAERLYDIVFLGTCIDAKARKKMWKRHFGAEISQQMEKAAEIALNEDKTSFISVLAKKLDPAEHQNAFEEVELYIKGVDRLALLEALSEHEVHVFGASTDIASWKTLLKHAPNIVIHPPVSYEKALTVMQQSKIVLNSSIKNKQGAHERIFTAAACGAVVVTNDNPWIRENFQNEKEILLYRNQNLKALDVHIKALLQNEAERALIAHAGRIKTMQAHTWDHRVKQLLKDAAPMLKKMKT